MKRLFLMSALLFIVNSLMAQTNDLIVTKNGDSISCKITLVNDENVFYEYPKKKSGFLSLTKVASYIYNNDTIYPNKTDSIVINYDGVEDPYIYCELVGIGKFFSFSGKVNVVVDFGEATKEMIKNEEGINKTFNSMIDALNYMGQFGWEFVQAYTVSFQNGNVYHWLLKKKIKKAP